MNSEQYRSAYAHLVETYRRPASYVDMFIEQLFAELTTTERLLASQTARVTELDAHASKLERALAEDDALIVKVKAERGRLADEMRRADKAEKRARKLRKLVHMMGREL